MPEERRPRPRLPRWEGLLVLGILGAAAAGAWGIILLSKGLVGGRRGRPRPASILPDRIPYRDLLAGEVRELPGVTSTVTSPRERSGQARPPRWARDEVEVTYRFEPDAEGGYPDLGDWSLIREPGSDKASGVLRGRGKLVGGAVLRPVFAGPVEVRLDLQIGEGSAAIAVARLSDRKAFELVVDESGGAVLREVEGKEAKVIAGPVVLEKPPGDAVLSVRLVRDPEGLSGLVGGETLRFRLDGARPDDLWRVGVFSREGWSLFDNIRVRGRIDRGWLEEALRTLLVLTIPDRFEPDDGWSLAGELEVGSPPQRRTLSPGGDEDWVGVEAAPGGPVRVEASDISLGASVELAAFGPDGKTPLDADQLPVEEPGASAIKVEPGGPGRFYVRVKEKEGRRGEYRLRAEPVSP